MFKRKAPETTITYQGNTPNQLHTNWLSTNSISQQDNRDSSYGFEEFLKQQPPSDYQDVLYPLRLSFGSNGGSNENVNNQYPCNQQHQNPNEMAPIFQPYDNTASKRVKFDEASMRNNQKPEAYYFTNYAQQEQKSLSLRQRVSNFFSSLF